MRIREERPDLVPFLLASLLAHLLLLIVLPMILWAPTFEEERVVEIFPIDLNRPDEKPYRIADIAEPKVQRRPKKADFLGMYDSSVKQQTVATRSGKGKGERGKGRGREGARQQQKSAMRSESLLAFRPSLFRSPAPKAARRRGEDAGRAPDDFYPDFRRGARTYLNVLRYPSVEYFVRMKRAFKITFSPESSLRAHFAHNRVTRGSVDVVLGVSVDPKGELAELFIFRSSGISSYDREAMRTVRASSPFSAPPQDFIDDDGLLRMSWTFTVYL